MFKGCSVWIENADGSVSDFDNRERTFTREEFEKFRMLQAPDYGVIVIIKPKPEEITNPIYKPFEEN